LIQDTQTRQNNPDMSWKRMFRCVADAPAGSSKSCVCDWSDAAQSAAVLRLRTKRYYKSAAGACCTHDHRTWRTITS